jgi:hypothetical protein
MLPFCRKPGSEPFCTVFRKGISEPIDDSIAQFIRKPARYICGGGQTCGRCGEVRHQQRTENLCHPQMKAEREAVATSRNKAMLQTLPWRADESSAAD